MSLPNGKQLEFQLSLFSESHDDAVALFDLICAAVGHEVVGCDDEIERLALLGVRHLARDVTADAAPLRALVTGPASSGKTTLVNAFADALGLPRVVIPAPAMAEMNWSGADVGDYLGQLYTRPLGTRGRARDAERTERAVVIVDDVDALRLPGQYGSASTRDYQLGRQQSLLPLVGGGVIPIERGQSTTHWPSHRALVIAVGTFAGIQSAVPSAEDLTDWGFIAPLADRLCSGMVIRMSELAASSLTRIVERNLAGAKAAFATFGYQLTISAEAIRFVSDHAERAEYGTVRAAIGCIAEAADRVLIGMLRDRVPAGAQRVLAPDDIRLAGGSRGVWRE